MSISAEVGTNIYLHVSLAGWDGPWPAPTRENPRHDMLVPFASSLRLKPSSSSSSNCHSSSLASSSPHGWRRCTRTLRVRRVQESSLMSCASPTTSLIGSDATLTDRRPAPRNPRRKPAEPLRVVLCQHWRGGASRGSEAGESRSTGRWLSGWCSADGADWSAGPRADHP